MNYFDAWISGQVDSYTVIYGLKIYEWNRVAKLIQFISGAIILAEIITYRRLNAFGEEILEMLNYEKLKRHIKYAIDRSFLRFLSGVGLGIDDPREILERMEEIQENKYKRETEIFHLDGAHPHHKLTYNLITIVVSFLIIYSGVSHTIISGQDWLSVGVIGVFLYVLSWYMISPLIYTLTFSILWLSIIFIVYAIIRPIAKLLSIKALDSL